jgi:hypothetical protein
VHSHCLPSCSEDKPENHIEVGFVSMEKRTLILRNENRASRYGV